MGKKFRLNLIMLFLVKTKIEIFLVGSSPTICEGASSVNGFLLFVLGLFPVFWVLANLNLIPLDRQNGGPSRKVMTTNPAFDASRRKLAWIVIVFDYIFLMIDSSFPSCYSYFSQIFLIFCLVVLLVTPMLFFVCFLIQC